MTRPIGIDLGTTYSAMAFVDDQGNSAIIPNADGKNITPSVLIYDGEDLAVGLDAKIAAAAAPENVAQFVKRSIGDSSVEWVFGHRRYTAVDLSAKILAKLKQDAELFLGEPICEAVITVPAYFAEAQRSNTLAAGQAAGLSVPAIINEPTAAAIDFGLSQVRSEQLILVYDLGGGTFDVTLMHVRPALQSGQAAQFEIIATDGNAILGGKDWDDAIVRFIAEAFEEKLAFDPCDDPTDYQGLILQAEQAKQQLSARRRVALDCHAGGRRLSLELSREDFEGMTRHLLDTTRNTVRDVLRAAQTAAEKVGTVLLVGGSTRMPMVREMLQEEFGKPPRSAPNPDETVAKGAAIYAATLVAGRHRLPAGRPEYAKRLGPIDVRDVTSHTLGTLARSGDNFVRSPIIRKNAPIPCREMRSDYATGRDNQDALVVPVLQGESDDPTKCDLIACWEFFGIPLRPAGASTLRVIFGYNVNGTVEVEAEDILTGAQLQKRPKKVAGIEELLTPPAPPLRVALCIDVSGSMSGQPLEEARRGAIDFAATLLGPSSPSGGPSPRTRPGLVPDRPFSSDKRLAGTSGSDCRIGLVSFESAARVDCPLVSDQSKLVGAINELYVRGGTDIAAGISMAHRSVLCDEVQRARCELVLFTDGGSAREPAIAAAEAAKRDGIIIRTIGCGSGVDKDLLARIASSKDQAEFISDASQIRSSLANVAVQINRGLRAR